MRLAAGCELRLQRHKVELGSAGYVWASDFCKYPRLVDPQKLVHSKICGAG